MKLKEITDAFSLLTLQEKFKVLDDTGTLPLTINYKWREEIQREIFNLPPKIDNNIHGPDGKNLSLKSKQLAKKNKKNTYPISFSQSFGVFGRINAYNDENKSHDCKNTYATVFSGSIPIITIFIRKNENFIKMFEDCKNNKKQQLSKKPNSRDCININFKMFQKYDLSYEIIQKIDTCFLNFDL